MTAPTPAGPYKGIPSFVPGNGSRRGGVESDGGPRILIVEDSPSARKLMQAQLTRLGVGLPNLRITATIPEAVQVFTQWQPHLVFVDLELRPPPDRPLPTEGALQGLPKDGGELVRHFLQRDPEVQLVVCSAQDAALSPLLAPLVRAGTIHAVVKPVLAARLQEVLARATAARETGPAPRRSSMT